MDTYSTLNPMRQYIVTLLVLGLICLVGCQHNDDDTPPSGKPPPIPTDTTLTGTASLGPIRNALVSVYALQDDGMRGAVLATALSNSSGEFTIDPVRAVPWVVCVSGLSSGNTAYNEEATGQVVEINETDELCAVRSASLLPQSIAITPLSHMAYGLTEYLARTGMGIQAIDESHRRFDAMATTQLDTEPPSALTDAVDVSRPYAIYYGAFLAAVSQYAHYVNTQTQQTFTSYDWADMAYRDIRYDGLLNGQGEEGVLNFAGLAVSANSYRHELIKRLFVFLDSDRNQSGLSASTFRSVATTWNDSNDAVFAGEPVMGLDTLSPMITNLSINESDTVSGTTTFSADVADIYGLSSVSFEIDTTPLADFDEHDVFTYELDTSQYPDGSHTLRVLASNQFDGQSTTEVNVVINNNQIVISNIQPNHGSFLRGQFDITVDVSDPQGINEVAFYRDNTFYQFASDVNNPSVMFNSTGRPDGVYPFHVEATNSVGARAVSDPVTYTIDNTDPGTTFNNLNEGDRVQNTLSIEWSATDNIELNTAELLLNGDPLATYSVFTSGIPPFNLNTALYDDGDHTLAITANDRAGNNTVNTLSIIIDNHAPVVAISNPIGGSTLTVPFNITHTETDTVGVISREYYIDEQSINVPAADPADYSDGDHTITVKAFDAIGNEGADSVNVVFDTHPPTITITQPLDGSYQTNAFNITADVSDTVGVDTVSYYIDNALLPNASIVVGDYTDGLYTLEVRASDVSGLNNSASVNVYIDNVLPSVSITSPLEGSIISGDFNLRANVSDSSGIQQVEYLIDDEHLAYPPSKDVPNMTISSSLITNGSHKFSVKVWDNAGRINQADVNVTISN